MENNEIKKIIEVLLFASDQPISASTFKNVLGDLIKDFDIKGIIKEIEEEYKAKNSPFEIRYIAGGWQFSTKKEFGPWIKKLFKARTTLRLSNSALETLSIIAYKQPITRSDIEEIRGVESSGVLDTLLERKLIRIVGRKEVLGRPLLYGTTQEFLRHFGLSHLSELPSLEEFIKQESEESRESENQSAQELPFENTSEEAEHKEETKTPVSSNDLAEELVKEKDDSVLN
ncbi:MAG: SMC-Scp complex subunit ScpB [Elusimicrobia bacterium]|nr:SMC-Scp complex subunit ScpB [Elusimicrobiota bacterium]